MGNEYVVMLDKIEGHLTKAFGEIRALVNSDAFLALSNKDRQVIFLVNLKNAFDFDTEGLS